MASPFTEALKSLLLQDSATKGTEEEELITTQRSHPVSLALFSRLMISHVQSAAKKKQAFAAKMSSFAKQNAARWFILGWGQTPFSP